MWVQQHNRLATQSNFLLVQGGMELHCQANTSHPHSFTVAFLQNKTVSNHANITTIVNS
jgi:hypothetical protein